MIDVNDSTRDILPAEQCATVQRLHAVHRPGINPEYESIADWEDFCVRIQHPGPCQVCMEPAAQGLQERQRAC